VLRLTGDTRAVAEAAAIAEHVASLTAAAAAFRLTTDVPLQPSHRQDGNAATIVPLVDETDAGEAAATLGEIRRWAEHALGIAHVPAIWRALAHDPRLLDATWRKDQLVLGAGTLDKLVKGCAALAVAEFRQSDYLIAYLTQHLRTACGADTGVLVEVAGAVMHYVSFNTIAHGMRLDAPLSGLEAADVAPGGRHEHLVPGVRRSVGSQSS
jgi:hypothetical protein